MLRFAEEILLLILDNEEGDVTSSLPPHSLDRVLAGAILMDLALENRIDTDPDQLMLIDPTPVGDELLDPVLAEIARESRPFPIAHWIEHAAIRGDDIRRKALVRLVDRGILSSDDFTLFFLSHRVSRSKRYPVVDGRASEEVNFRIMRLLFSDDIPDPRDIVIVGLAAACGLFKFILSREELSEVQPRIDQIARMDLIAQSVARALQPAISTPPVPSARPPEEIPKVSGLPLFGSAFDMARNLRSFLGKHYRELGPIFEFRALNQRYVALVGPEANRFVQKRGRHFLRSHETWQDFNAALGAKDALMSLDGPSHVRMRKVHSKPFSPRYITDRIDDVVGITRGMVSEWTIEGPVAALYAMQGIIAEQLALLTTGVSARGHADDLIATLDSLLNVHVMRQRPGLVLKLPRLRRARRRMDELYEIVLARHAGERNTNPDLIDNLLELRRSDPQFFPETDLQLAVLGPFLAGIETAANTSAFMLYALLKHPGLLERMRVEADAFFDRGALTAESLRELDVTRRIVLETLRMYPIASALSRTAANSFEFAGHTVPARSKIIIGSTVPHHLPECFAEPERFDIDRFTPERAEHEKPGAFAPYGLGTHRCLGSGFAETQIALTLLTIVRDVELRLDPPDYKLKLKHAPTLHPGPSFRFRVTRRRHAARPDSG